MSCKHKHKWYISMRGFYHNLSKRGTIYLFCISYSALSRIVTITSDKQVLIDLN